MKGEIYVEVADGLYETTAPTQDDLAPQVRPKSRRSRLKNGRAKRDRYRFFAMIQAVGLRARKTGVRHNSPKARNHNGR